LDLAKNRDVPDFAGAPRPMKMGNIVSPWRYDAGACHTLSQENSRLTAIYRHTSEPVEFGPISAFKAVRQQHK
jgi:hypothetical protein